MASGIGRRYTSARLIKSVGSSGWILNVIVTLAFIWLPIGLILLYWRYP